MKQANAKQKRFIANVSEWATNGGMFLLYGIEWCRPFHIHHVTGRSSKQNKVAIGHDFILPVPIELHDPNLNHELHVSKCKHRFTGKFGKQSFLYDEMYNDMSKQNYEMPNREILEAIASTGA